MRSLPFPRRLQLVKLLRAHGLRDVERLREDELKEALARLSILLPDVTGPSPGAGPEQPHVHGAMTSASSNHSSNMGGGTRSQPAPETDGDDPSALPRFREPRLFLPENERTFLRCVAVKPRMLFFTWDLHKELPRDRPAQLHIFVRDTLGDPPDAADVLAQHPSFVVDIEASAPGWYVEVPGERVAVAAALVLDGVRVALSNLAIMPPARPAPPGPLWEATLTPGTSRRALRKAGLLRPDLPKGVSVVNLGEATRQDPPDDDGLETGGAGSALWMKNRPAGALAFTGIGTKTASSPSSSTLPSSSSSLSLSSSSSSSASAVRQP